MGFRKTDEPKDSWCSAVPAYCEAYTGTLLRVLSSSRHLMMSSLFELGALEDPAM